MIKDLQRRSRELGRIRTGHKDAGRGFPKKLSHFRLTSQARPLLERVAELYGGEVNDWTPSGGVPQFEVYTTSNRIPIIVPPQPVTQWMEFWLGGVCKHRCNGETNFLTGEPCDLDEEVTVRVRGNDTIVNPHTEAKPTTRLKVILRDVEGVGMWRLESHGWNAAAELPDTAEFLAAAGGYVDGFLCLEERVTKSIGPDGQTQTNRFMVPTIEVGVTPAQLLAGQGRIVPALSGGPVPLAQSPTPELAGPTAPQNGAQAPNLPTVDDILAATDLDTLGRMWQDLEDAGAHTHQTNAAGATRHAQLAATTPTPDEAAAPAPPDGDEAAAADAAWQRVLRVAGSLEPPMTTPDVVQDFTTQHGVGPDFATSVQLSAYADQLEGAQA